MSMKRRVWLRVKFTSMPEPRAEYVDCSCLEQAVLGYQFLLCQAPDFLARERIGI